MREIKFRAWLGGVMHPIWYGIDPEVNKMLYKSIVLMQYTGLKDKNGKEIYEGDIVKKKHTNTNKLKSEDLLHEVVFSHGSFQLDNYVDEDYLDFDFDLVPDQLEVIGNIYENSELLDK